MTPGQGEEGVGLRTLRRLLLAVVALGVLGLGAELVLLEHWESPLEWPPLVGLVAAVPLLVKVGARPTRATVRTFRTLMGLFVVVGTIGVWSHWRSNALLELEMDPTIEGWRYFRRVLFGGTPVLAPGALVHMGLVGLLATFRHPATERASRADPGRPG